MGEQGEIAATLICGDNYFNSNTKSVLETVIQQASTNRADVFVAGPAFNAGRYGFACGETCKNVAAHLEIPCLTALYAENPAVETYRKLAGIWILPTDSRALGMSAVLPKLAALALKLGTGSPIGPANEEGYLPTGRRVLGNSPVRTVDRAFDMLMAKIEGLPYRSEISIEKFDAVPPAPAIKDVKSARLAVITTSGLVPKGNPDHFRMFNATQWQKYRLPDDGTLRSGDWEVIHGGFNTAYAEANPHLVLPLDALVASAGTAYRDLDKFYYSITGVGTSLKIAKEVGQEIAASLREDAVDAVLLVAT
jgi:glycine reductase